MRYLVMAMITFLVMATITFSAHAHENSVMPIPNEQRTEICNLPYPLNLVEDCKVIYDFGKWDIPSKGCFNFICFD